MTVKDLLKFKIKVHCRRHSINGKYDIYEFVNHADIYFQIYSYDKSRIMNGINTGKFRSVVWGKIFRERHVNHKYNLEDL